MLYDRASFSVRRMASLDETRPAITGISFEADGSTVATNGYAIARVAPSPSAELDAEFPDVHLEPGVQAPAHEPLAPFILPASLATEIARSLPRPRPEGTSASTMRRRTKRRRPSSSIPAIMSHAHVRNAVVNASQNAAVVVSNLATSREFKARKIDAKFPDWRKVFPGGAPAVQFALNARLLKTICEMAIECGEEQITFSPISAQTGVRFEARRLAGSKPGRLSGVVMPIRIEEVNGS